MRPVAPSVTQAFRGLVGRFLFPPHVVQPVPEVTLACVDCVDPQQGAYALVMSMRGQRWGQSLLLSDRQPDWLPTGAEWVEIPKLDSLNSYNLFCLLDLVHYVDTPHVLTVQSDGWVLCPELWDFGWLDFDYIGAPWLRSPHAGNSGFCLRSRRLLEATARLVPFHLDRSLQANGRILDDVFTCIDCRQKIEASGCRIAPQEIAGRFAVEAQHPWTAKATFGYHDWRDSKRRPTRSIWLTEHLRDLGEALRDTAVTSVV